MQLLSERGVLDEADIVYDPPVMARSLGALYIAGATIGLISLLLPRAPHTNVGALAMNIAMAYAGGVIVLTGFRQMPVWAFHLALAAGTLLITRAIYYSGHGVSYYGIWYLWAALFGFSFFKRSHAAIHVATVGLAYAAVLEVRHEPVAVARWTTTVASLLIAGVFIDALVRRVRRQRRQAAEDAENLAAIVGATQRIFQDPTAECAAQELCNTAADIGRADGAALWEPGEENDPWTVVAVSGRSELAEQLPPSCASARGFACTDSAPILERDASGGETVACALWQPVIRGESTIAMLALYWIEPVSPPQQNVRAAIVLLTAQTAIAIERADLLTRLRRIAHTDELTGLPNRRAWQEVLPREMSRARRENWPLCVVMLDIDSLKKINDTQGHHAGDQLLRQTAATWSSGLRPDDLLARYGGDEFAAVLTRCGFEEAQDIVARLADATADAHSFSAGIAQWDGRQDTYALMARADAQLYAAKGERPQSRPALDGPQREQPSHV